jgi:hypothetical protein
MLEDFLRWLDRGPEALVGLANALATCELNLAAYDSAIRGDQVDLPLRDDLDAWPVEVLARRAAGAPPGAGGMP